MNHTSRVQIAQAKQQLVEDELDVADPHVLVALEDLRKVGIHEIKYQVNVSYVDKYG